MFGKAGTGKTTTAFGAAKAVLFGEGFLDHPHPAKRGSVLFIASDSGPGPLMTVIQKAGLSDHPFFEEGPEQRFHVWASDRKQGMSAWVADLRGCLRLSSSSSKKASIWLSSTPASQRRRQVPSTTATTSKWAAC